MNLWINLYLGAFLVGLIAIAGMLLAGGGGHASVHSAADAPASGSAMQGAFSAIAPFLNFTSFVALLMCGGGSGYVALELGAGPTLSLIAATADGMAGAWLVATVIRLFAR
ncbi:MAG TPA: hypothetical protein VG496_19805 [Myxococcales bacterium]|nr:hypothetical protein [Myxococcales bacterium]